MQVALQEKFPAVWDRVKTHLQDEANEFHTASAHNTGALQKDLHLVPLPWTLARRLQAGDAV